MLKNVCLLGHFSKTSRFHKKFETLYKSCICRVAKAITVSTQMLNVFEAYKTVKLTSKYIIINLKY